MQITDNTKWLMLVITNGVICEEQFTIDSQMDHTHWAIFNVSQTNRMICTKLGSINALDITGYQFKGPTWAEAEVIYNISRLNLFAEYDYLGFIHYDFMLRRQDTSQTNITQQINESLNSNEWISFQDTTLYTLLFKNRQLVLDDRYPQYAFLSPDIAQFNPIQAVPCMLNVISANTKHNMLLPSLDVYRKLTACSAFISKRENILEIGKLMEVMLKTYRIEHINQMSNSRYIGNLFERMIMLYSYSFQHKEIPLIHFYVETSKGH